MLKSYSFILKDLSILCNIKSIKRKASRRGLTETKNKKDQGGRGGRTSTSVHVPVSAGRTVRIARPGLCFGPSLPGGSGPSSPRDQIRPPLPSLI